MSVTTVRTYHCDHPGCTTTATGSLPADWLDSRGGRKGFGHRCSEHVVEPCRSCNRPTRPQKARSSRYPGTVQRTSNGWCVNCVRGGAPVDNVPATQVRYIKRLIENRVEDPDDRLLLMDALGIGGDL